LELTAVDDDIGNLDAGVRIRKGEFSARGDSQRPERLASDPREALINNDLSVDCARAAGAQAALHRGEWRITSLTAAAGRRGTAHSGTHQGDSECKSSSVK
jgi:hypothetical protein